MVNPIHLARFKATKMIFFLVMGLSMFRTLMLPG